MIRPVAAAAVPARTGVTPGATGVTPTRVGVIPTATGAAPTRTAVVPTRTGAAPARTGIAATRTAAVATRTAVAAASIFLLFLALLPLASRAAAPPRIDSPEAVLRVEKVVAGTGSAFVLLDLTHGGVLRVDPQRCAKRLTPFSTFKIPNSLIGLETGLVKDPDAVVHWDRKAYPPESHWPDGWKQDHSLRTAFKASAVWWYRDLAKRIGPERMKKFLRQFGYGNQDIQGGIDRFWLASSLGISADEQAEFLKRFLENKLGLSPKTVATARELFVYEKTPTYTLSAKTGGGPTGPGQALGWFVGYVETRGAVYVFALNTDGPSYQAIRDKRIELVKGALQAAGVLP